MCVCALKVLTIARIQDLHRSRGRELHGSHHRLRKQNPEGFCLLVLPIGQYSYPPRGSGLSRVELDLPLGLTLEILLPLCTAILCANAWKIQADCCKSQDPDQYLDPDQALTTWDRSDIIQEIGTRNLAPIPQCLPYGKEFFKNNNCVLGLQCSKKLNQM